jgi:riboflavin kinase / FMN adenylyltransferase
MMEYQTTVAKTTPIVITIGNFDGIHLGHQRLLHKTVATAHELQSEAVMVTFSPHTLSVIRPNIDAQYLTTLDEKIMLAKKYGGIHDCIVIHFTPEVMALSAEQFMDDLCAHFTIKGLVVGEDFSLGRNRMGNVAFLQDYGERKQIHVESVSLEEAGQARISSTRIRALVAEGNVTEANELLGHPTLASGVVVHGEKRGRQLNFPTANLRPQEHKLLPANGVYAVLASIQEGLESDSREASRVSIKEDTYRLPGACNVGIRPHFDGKERLIEVYLLDFDRDIYGKYLVVEFIQWLRGEERFADIDALKAQMAADVEQTRQILTHKRGSN